MRDASSWGRVIRFRSSRGSDRIRIRYLACSRGFRVNADVQGWLGLRFGRGFGWGRGMHLGGGLSFRRLGFGFWPFGRKAKGNSSEGCSFGGG